MTGQREGAIRRTQWLGAAAVGLGLIPIFHTLLGFFIPPAVVDAEFIRKTFTPDVELFRPKPLETVTFLLSIVLLPPCLLGVAAVLGRYLRQLADTSLRYVSQIALWAFAVGLLVLWFDSGDFFETLFRVTTHPRLERIVVVTAAAVLFRWNRRAAANHRYSRVALWAIYGAAAVTFLPVTLANGGAAPHDFLRGESFEAVSYSLTQVLHGRALLVNLTSQYGLYPQFIEPLFRIVRLTPLSFTMLMWVLICTCYGALLLFLRGCMRGAILIALSFLALVYYSLHSSPLGILEPYFQYRPIRMLFPCCGLFLFGRYISRPSMRLYYLSFVFSFLGVLWNPESGIVVCGTWLVLLTYRELATPPIPKALRGIFTHVLAAVWTGGAVGVVYASYTFLRYHSWPDFRLLFISGSLFYRYGLLSLPLSVHHMWILVVVTYLAGMAKALQGLIDHENSAHNQLILIVTVMGVGLFSYYQGRGPDDTLMLAGYPALIVVGLFVDGACLSRAAGEGDGSFAIRLAPVFIAFLVLCFPTVLFPSFLVREWPFIGETVRAFLAGRPGWYASDVQFVKKHSLPGQPVAILSFQRAATLHMGTQTPSYFDGPGFIEMLLRSQERALVNQLSAARDVPVFLDVQTVLTENQPGFSPAVLGSLIRDWQAVDQDVTSGGDLIFFRRVQPDEHADQAGWMIPEDPGSRTLLHVRRGQSGLLADAQGNYAGFLTAEMAPLSVSDDLILEALVRVDQHRMPGTPLLTTHEWRIEPAPDGLDSYRLTIGNGHDSSSGTPFRLPFARTGYLSIHAGPQHAEVYIDGAVVAELAVPGGMARSDFPVSLGTWREVASPSNAEIREVYTRSGTLTRSSAMARWLLVRTALEARDRKLSW